MISLSGVILLMSMSLDEPGGGGGGGGRGCGAAPACFFGIVLHVQFVNTADYFIDADSMATRQRKRKVCCKCEQELSHSAFIRHQNPAVCPRKDLPSNSLAIVDASSLDTEHLYGDNELDVSPRTANIPFDSSSESEFESEVESDVDDGVAVVSDTDEFSAEEDTNVCTPVCSVPNTMHKGDTSLEKSVNTDDEGVSVNATHELLSSNKEQMRVIATHICLFVSFFQLCYKVSERGISLLLSFIRALIFWASSVVKSADFLMLRDMLPKNVQKLCGTDRHFTTYVVCPKCNYIYPIKQCIITHRNGTTESAKCSYVQYPNHPHRTRREKCNGMLMKKVKYGSKYKLVPCKVYTYVSLKSSLAQLFGRPGFSQKCELWRNRSKTSNVYTDIYDGLVWEKYQAINGRPFLQVPNNLCLILNLDWFNPFKHIEYSVGVIYLVIANLPRSERYKLENVIIVGTIPGPREPKKHVNFYLKPLVDELLDLWHGTFLKASSLFGVVPVRCALMCVTCDLPATRKVCGFASYSAIQGCSKCMKQFPCESFGTKLDYSGYNRETWPVRTSALHMQQVSHTEQACTATKKK